MFEIKQVLQTGLRLSLGISYQQTLNKRWNRILSDPFAFTPHESRGYVSLQEAITENEMFGEFASSYLKRTMRQSEARDEFRRRNEGKIVAAVGFGHGHDADWVSEAAMAGYKICWIDVSDLACEMANAKMRSHWEHLRSRGIIYPQPIVIQEEIRSFLASPNKTLLDLNKVEIWYFCRTLGCLSTRSARIVLQQLGSLSLSKDSDNTKRNKIIIVNALRDNNPKHTGKTATLHSKRFILYNTRLGACRRVKVSYEDSHIYFGKFVSAITISAE